MKPDVGVGLVPVDSIRFHPHNVHRDLGDLRGLVASIQRFGVMQPVVVERYGDQVRLRAGHRRVAAARIAGLSKVPALVHAEALEDDEWLLASVHENAQRRNLDVEERKEIIGALRELGCSWAGIAEAFGVHQNTITKWVREKQADDGTQVIVRKSRPSIKSTVFTSFARAWRAADWATVDDVLTAVEQMAATGRLTLPGTPPPFAYARPTGYFDDEACPRCEPALRRTP